MKISNEAIFSAVSLGASANSAAIDSSFVLSVSIQAVVSSSAGSPVGTLKLQGSNDQPQTGGPSNWSDIASATVSVNDDGTYLIGKTDICHQYIRAVYTRTSGTGSMTARLKSIGV